MKHQINCTPSECIKFRKDHTLEELNWAAEAMFYYRCYPIDKEARMNTTEFVADVFEAGRISGVRAERKKRHSNSQTFANLKVDCLPLRVSITYERSPQAERWAKIIVALADAVVGNRCSIIAPKSCQAE